MAACRHPTQTAEAVEIHHCWQPGLRAAVEVVEIHHDWQPGLWRCPATAVDAMEIHHSKQPGLWRCPAMTVEAAEILRCWQLGLWLCPSTAVEAVDPVECWQLGLWREAVEIHRCFRWACGAARPLLAAGVMHDVLLLHDMLLPCIIRRNPVHA